jgi:hypothetical protein
MAGIVSVVAAFAVPSQVDTRVVHLSSKFHHDKFIATIAAHDVHALILALTSTYQAILNLYTHTHVIDQSPRVFTIGV